MVNELSEQAFSIPALGRLFHLGMLYDCRSEKIIPGITLWDQRTLDGKMVHKCESADYEIIASDTIDDKSSALEVNVGLKLSFLGGLLQVSGSGKYLDNRKSSNHVERVTLKYKCTTKSEVMTMEQLGKGKIEHPEVFDHGTATHVVTGITYGGNAFFVFDRELSTNSSDRGVSGNLHAVIKSIPLIQIDGKGELDLSENEKKEANNFSCRYFGDFLPRENPSSFQESVRFYKQLPTIIGENGENAVPINVHLYPLIKLDSKACKLVREISANLVKETENYLEDLYEFDVKCNDLLKSQALNHFRGIRVEIQKFKSLLAIYKLGFQKEVAQVLPGIRGGSKEEGELALILKKREASPFSNEALSSWMEAKESQVKILMEYTSSLSQIRFASQPGDLQSMVLSPKHSQVLCFSILMPKSNSHLTNMSKYLDEEHPASNKDSLGEKAKIPLTIVENESTMMQKARHFRDFFNVNKDNADVGYIVAEESNDKNEFQAKIRYYDNGSLSQEDFDIPSSPNNVSADTTHDSIMVQWEKPHHGALNINQYNVFCEYTAESNAPVMQCADSNATSYRIVGLKPGCEYCVSVQSVCKLGVSLKSNVSGTVKTRPTSPPGKPEAWKISPSKIGIKWSNPLHIGSQCTGIKYVVKQQEEESDWQDVSSLPFGNLSVKMDANPNITYRFKVYCTCEHCGKSLDSEASNDLMIKIKPEEVLKAELCRQSKTIQDENITIYQPNLKLVLSNEMHKFQKYEFGQEKDAMPEKVIMLVGSTGSGKTTLINGLINYIFAVDWNDNFRFKLITEPESQNQAKSQTVHISSYTIHHQEGFKVPYTLTIIDTPGFGDVQGIDRDKEITQQIRTFFTTGGIRGIDKLDAVGFVVQSCLPRLTPTQIYIFDQILSLFGKDIADNIFLLLTFADGKRPQVLSGIEEAKMPYRKFFKFNNSALYARNKELESQEQDSGDDEDNAFDTMYWNMGEKSFRIFFKDISMTESKSLTLTKEVLNERHQLEVSIAGIRVDIQIGLNKLEQLRKEVDVLTTHQADIDKNKNFVYTVTEETFLKESIPPGQYVTNCLNCNRTCHEVCEIPEDDRKQYCSAMSNGYCRICPANCFWDLHKNIPYKFVCKQVQVQKTAEDLRRRYQEAEKKKLSAVNLVKKVNEEFEAVQLKVLGMTETVRKSLLRLKEIALKPNPLSTVEYIDILIESEKSQARPGWQARAKQLQNVRKQAEYIKEIADQGFDPFIAIKKKIEEEKKENRKGVWSQV
ncbi:uncharacterized protein LOC135215534 [Macrobrachium nipponense]|uniref:uncharacterized protein LOC135215534 n=1 Tax=Macrobrachium nipponense TaxID=159736 RepID=UPI0030C8CF1F